MGLSPPWHSRTRIRARATSGNNGDSSALNWSVRGSVHSHSVQICILEPSRCLGMAAEFYLALNVLRPDMHTGGSWMCVCEWTDHCACVLRSVK